MLIIGLIFVAIAIAAPPNPHRNNLTFFIENNSGGTWHVRFVDKSSHSELNAMELAPGESKGIVWNRRHEIDGKKVYFPQDTYMTFQKKDSTHVHNIDGEELMFVLATKGVRIRIAHDGPAFNKPSNTHSVTTEEVPEA